MCICIYNILLVVTCASSVCTDLLMSSSQGSNQSDGSSQELHQVISEGGESLIVAADSFVGDDSVEALETQVVYTQYIYNKISMLINTILFFFHVMSCCVIQ